MANAELYEVLGQNFRDIETQKAEAEAAVIQTRQLSERLVAAQSSKDQFIGGTTKTGESLRVENLGRLEAQSRAQKAYQAANAEELSIVLGQDLAQLAMQSRQLTAKIQKDAAVSIFDDPLTAIANAFTLPWDEQALEGVTQKIDVTKKAMNAVDNHVQNAAQTAEAVRTKVTDASIASEATALANYFTEKAAAAELVAIETNAKATERVLNLNAKGADVLMKVTQLQDADEARAQRREQHTAHMKQVNAQLEKIADEKLADEYKFKRINAVLALEGKNQLEPTRYKLMKGTSAKYLDTLLQKGIELEVSGRDNFSHGPTISDRFDYQDVIGWKPNPDLPAQEKVMSMQYVARSNAAESAGKDKANIDRVAEQQFAQAWKNEQNNIMEGSAFRAPATIVFAQNSDIVRNPIWQKYIKPTLTVESAKKPLSENLVIEAASTAVAQNVVTSAQAAAFIAQVFQQAVHVNNTVNEFEKIAGRKQTKYGFRAQTGYLYGKDTVDLTDPVSAQAVLQGAAIARGILSAVGANNDATRDYSIQTGRFDASGLDMQQGGGNPNVQIPPMPRMGVNVNGGQPDVTSEEYRRSNQVIIDHAANLPRTSYDSMGRYLGNRK